MGQQPPRRVSGGFARDHSSGLHEPLRLVATIVLDADVSLSGNLDHRTFPTSCPDVKAQRCSEVHRAPIPTPAMDLASRLRLHEKKIGNNR
jgi:hypothetical protein